MIQFIEAAQWKAHSATVGKKYVVDLRGSQSKQEILRSMGKILKGKDSPLINGNSLDALNDVMSDWFCENWGKEKQIYIIGWEVVGEIHSELPVILADIVNSAFLGAVYDKCLRGDSSSVPDEINNFSVFLVN
ncbi:hypothetical protein [Polycladidibacter stylochi]|uniref:hypothetical protein n=1 Tax=Polycladidibacter stylochi TaxID=1807766 RepID=UPI0008320047|nr:hypothetical protein [Pseudovibrio stylochi]